MKQDKIETRGATSEAKADNQIPIIQLDPRKWDLKGTMSQLADLDPNFMKKLYSMSKRELDQEMLSNPLTKEAYIDFLVAVSEAVKKQIEDQKPGSSAGMSPQLLAHYGVGAITRGGFAARVQGNSLVCIYNPEQEKDVIRNNVSLMSGVPFHLLKPLPGTQDQWRQFIDDHERQHCNHTHTQDPVARLNLEIEADNAAIQKLRSQGQTQMAQAVLDLRIIGAVMDSRRIDHATGFFIGSSTSVASQQDMNTIANLRSHMTEEVAKKLGVSRETADALFESDPKKFNQTVKELLKEGKFNSQSSPKEARFVQMYLDAFERRVNAPEGLRKKASLDVESLEPGKHDYIASNEMMENDTNKIMSSSTKPALDREGWLMLVGNQDIRDYFLQLASQTQPTPQISVNHETNLNNTATMRVT